MNASSPPFPSLPSPFYPPHRSILRPLPPVRMYHASFSASHYPSAADRNRSSSSPLLLALLPLQVVNLRETQIRRVDLDRRNRKRTIR